MGFERHNYLLPLLPFYGIVIQKHSFRDCFSSNFVHAVHKQEDILNLSADDLKVILIFNKEFAPPSSNQLIVLENIPPVDSHSDPDYISRMPKATKLSKLEQGKTLALKVEGMSNWKITKKIWQSRMPVDNFLKDPDGYNRVQAVGRPGPLSEL
ncbi:---NA--- [Octopus vulgaris]|uniref:---NA n=1 Tax=Octopus vulgaris TaxID=6645 RepID=A0AA36BJ14_OCTVU|nr:---NA--- [Octopus vulgaris]